MQKNLEDSKRDIIEQTEKIETKIHGLISSIFKKKNFIVKVSLEKPTTFCEAN